MDFKKYLCEFIGTYMLVLVGTGSIIVNALTNNSITHMGICIIFGIIVMVMIYTLGPSSGAHMNPAVTIAFFFKKVITLKDTVLYILFQLLGAILASLTNLFLFEGTNTYLGSTHPRSSELQSLVLEILLTFILMFVVQAFGSGDKNIDISAPIAIGAVITMNAMFGGPISGASMNPVRSLGPAIVSGNLTSLWIYLVGPITGATIAVITYEIIFKKSKTLF